MYVNPKTGSAAAITATAPTLHLASFRQNILAVLAGNSLFTADEQQRASANVRACQDAQRLAVWLKNVHRVAAEREQAQALVLLAVDIKRFEAELSAEAKAATSWQRNNLKAAVWKLNISDVQREHFFDRILAPALTSAAAARLLLELECADPAPEPNQWATPAQCDELYRLACHPALTPVEKSQALALLPTLTQTGAVQCIGRLYDQVFLRTGVQLHTDGSTQLAA